MPNVPLYSKWRRETLSFSVPKSTVLQDIGHPRSRVFCLFVLAFSEFGEAGSTLLWPPLSPLLHWMHCNISALRSRGGRCSSVGCSLIHCRAQASCSWASSPHRWQLHQSGKDKESVNWSVLAVILQDCVDMRVHPRLECSRWSGPFPS